MFKDLTIEDIERELEELKKMSKLKENSISHLTSNTEMAYFNVITLVWKKGLNDIHTLYRGITPQYGAQSLNRLMPLSIIRPISNSLHIG